MTFRFYASPAITALFTLFLAGFPMNEGSPADAPKPADLRREGNRLKQESSLYLQQHARNPLDWYPWGAEALDRARNEDKPIFLSIGYASCHWCHVMEHEVFEQDDVAEFMNRNFVCIKVDREERPDLDAVYMDAVQAISGRGGWPLSIFLTPDQKPIFGGTYFPRETFLELAAKIHNVFNERRADVEQQAEQVTAHVTALPSLVSAPGLGKAAAVSDAIIDAAALQAEVNYDIKWGGFKSEQKFPTPVRWQFLLHQYRKTGNRRLANLVQLTLEKMASGGIQDHVGGGFHRYTVDRKWIVPHFEKMLYDNAQLASLYLEAGVLMGRDDFRAIGLDVLDFLIREMSGEEGAFYSSFDADSDGQEGTFYVWTLDEITLASNPEDGPVLSELLGVGPPGNFEHGTTVLTRRVSEKEIATEYEWELEKVAGLFAKHRDNLRTHRAKRVPPALDRKIVTSWNGLTVSALAHGYAVSGRRKYLEAAARAIDFLERVHWTDNGALLRASTGGRAEHDGILDDYAFLACGLLDLYQVSGEVRYLEKSLALIERARADFAHPQGGFYMSSAGTEAPLGRKMDFFDSVIPSGNSAMLQALVRAAALTGKAQYREEIEKCLTAYAGLIEQASLEMAWWLDAAQKWNGPFYEVVVAGGTEVADGSARVVAGTSLAGTVLGTLPANAVVVQVPAEGPAADLAALVPPATGKVASDGKAMAYVCEHGSCQAPTADAEQLLAQLAVGWKGAHEFR